MSSRIAARRCSRVPVMFRVGDNFHVIRYDRGVEVDHEIFDYDTFAAGTDAAVRLLTAPHRPVVWLQRYRPKPKPVPRRKNA